MEETLWNNDCKMIIVNYKQLLSNMISPQSGELLNACNDVHEPICVKFTLNLRHFGQRILACILKKKKKS